MSRLVKDPFFSGRFWMCHANQLDEKESHQALKNDLHNVKIRSDGVLSSRFIY